MSMLLTHIDGMTVAQMHMTVTEEVYRHGEWVERHEKLSVAVCDASKEEARETCRASFENLTARRAGHTRVAPSRPAHIKN